MKKSNKSAILGTFTGKCCDATVSNNNDMFLGKELFEKIFNSEDYKRAIKNRYYIGFLGHPEDPGCMDFEHACIVMTDCWIDDNGEVYGKFDLVDTPVGRVVKAFIDAGVTFGISIRGAGDIAGDGTVDPDTFVFRGFDLVTFPAYDDAVPTFTEIAASTSLDKQVKYKKVCAAINTNMKSITSSSALSAIQEQFNANSDEYKLIEDRKNEISASTKVDETSILQEKLRNITALYAQQVKANTEMRKSVAKMKSSLASEQFKCRRKVATLKKITCSQTANLEDTLDELEGKYRREVKAATLLKAQVEQLKKNNLKYTHTIEANSRLMRDKDSAISNLKAELRETVTASNKIEKRASNLDEEIMNLRNRVEAAEQIVLDYQKAYANMYANALGVRIENIPVTASTSVEELKSLISAGTNTSGLASTVTVEPYPVEVNITDDIDEDDNDIITL